LWFDPLLELGLSVGGDGPLSVYMLREELLRECDNLFQVVDEDHRWAHHQAKHPNPKRMLAFLETEYEQQESDSSHILLSLSLLLCGVKF
jgi:hypothetical protein